MGAVYKINKLLASRSMVLVLVTNAVAVVVKVEAFGILVVSKLDFRQN